MAILVTGAAGFIGHHVCKALLARGQDVIGLDNFTPYYNVQLKRDRLAAVEGSPGFSFLELDLSQDEVILRELGALPLTGIVHLAAQPGVRYSLTHPFAYAKSNLMGHLTVLELARILPELKHLVYASSSSVYGGNTSLPFKVEDRVSHPVSLYAATKRSDELMSETYSHLYRIPQTGLRFFTVYGPWYRPDMALWLFTEAILNDKPIRVFNNGDMRRDFTYIDDITAGVLAALDTPPPDETSCSPHRIYNLGNHSSERLLDVIATLESALGKKAERILEPMQPGDVKDTFADIEATQRDLGFEPQVSIHEGIPKFVDWYREYHGR